MRVLQCSTHNRCNAMSQSWSAPNSALKASSRARSRLWFGSKAPMVNPLADFCPKTTLFSSSRRNKVDGSVAKAYLRLGVDHLISGVDHVMFVLGLLILIGWNKRLLWAITAFTVGHSITLALASLGLNHISEPTHRNCYCDHYSDRRS